MGLLKRMRLILGTQGKPGAVEMEGSDPGEHKGRP